MIYGANWRQATTLGVLLTGYLPDKWLGISFCLLPGVAHDIEIYEFKTIISKLFVQPVCQRRWLTVVVVGGSGRSKPYKQLAAAYADYKEEEAAASADESHKMLN